MYKSKFEETVASQLGDYVKYEPDKIVFIQPEKKRFYLPDFKLADNIYIETKGKWVADDRAKHVLLKEQHPEITIYILFQNSSVKINKRSKTSYGDWATKNGLIWADYRKDGIPNEWIEHATKARSRDNRRTNRTHTKSK